MPPFHSTSTGARKMVDSNSFGVNVCCSVPRRLRASGLKVIDFSERGNTAPPMESSDVS